ncbi:MAG: PEP-CTERM sorting domain-containing protein, partial [Aureliella sp.]
GLPPDLGNNDYGFFSVSTTAPGGPQIATLLADATAANANPVNVFPNPPSTPTDPPFNVQTGTAQMPYALASYTFTVAGDYTIGFGIVNVLDANFSSGLLIDNVTAVPEPTALAGLGLVGLALTLRRRRK